MDSSNVRKNPFGNPPKENNPEPGQYDRHLTKFGSDSKKFSIGLPHKWKPD